MSKIYKDAHIKAEDCNLAFPIQINMLKQNRSYFVFIDKFKLHNSSKNIEIIINPSPS